MVQIAFIEIIQGCINIYLPYHLIFTILQAMNECASLHPDTDDSEPEVSLQAQILFCPSVLQSRYNSWQC